MLDKKSPEIRVAFYVLMRIVGAGSKLTNETNTNFFAAVHSNIKPCSTTPRLDSHPRRRAGGLLKNQNGGLPLSACGLQIIANVCNTKLDLFRCVEFNHNNIDTGISLRVVSSSRQCNKVVNCA